MFFEHDFTSLIPFVPQRNDVRLTVKFQYCNYVSGIGDMVALFNADELARSGGNLNHAKAICMVNLAGHFGSMSVAFQRKNLLNDIFFSNDIFLCIFTVNKKILIQNCIISAYQLKQLEGKFVFLYIRTFPDKVAIGRSNYYHFSKPQVVSYLNF